MYKIVYCLVSDEKDWYLNQLIISLLTIRQRMKNAEVIVLCDIETYNHLQGERGKIFSLATSVLAIEIPIKFEKRQRSRYLKTKSREYIEGDYLYIDTDTTVCCSISEPVLTGHIGVVSDCHTTGARSTTFDSERENKLFSFGYHFKEWYRYYNSGVLWVRDTSESYAFFELWHSLWKEHMDSFVYDQPALNEAIYRSNIDFTEMDGTWNCQVLMMSGAFPFINNAKIIHYFGGIAGEKACGYDALADEVLGQALEETHPLVDEIVENPRGAFKRAHIVNLYTDNVWEAFNSNSFRFVAYLQLKHKKLFNFFEKVFGALIKRH